jgi:hypothetical protein
MLLGIRSGTCNIELRWVKNHLCCCSAARSTLM